MKVSLSLRDLSGQDQHSEVRKWALSKADAIIFCFTLADIFTKTDFEKPANERITPAKLSLSNVQSKWLKEAQ